MKNEMTIEYLMCTVDINFGVDFRVNSILVRLQPCGILFYSENESFLFLILYFNPIYMSLICTVNFYVLYFS